MATRDIRNYNRNSNTKVTIRKEITNLLKSRVSLVPDKYIGILLIRNIMNI